MGEKKEENMRLIIRENIPKLMLDTDPSLSHVMPCHSHSLAPLRKRATPSGHEVSEGLCEQRAHECPEVV